jgi:hypothetical protein
VATARIEAGKGSTAPGILKPSRSIQVHTADVAATTVSSSSRMIVPGSAAGPTSAPSNSPAPQAQAISILTPTGPDPFD